MYSQYSWGGVPRRVPEPGGMCANTYTHVPVCAGTIHTHPRVPALSFPWLQLGHRAVAPRLSEPQLWPYSVSARHLPPSPACHVQLCLEGRGCLSAPRGGQTKEASEVGASTTHTAFLFLQRLMEKHSPQARPDPALASASEQERPQVCRVLEPTTSRSTETASPRWGPGWSWPQPPDVAEARPAGWDGRRRPVPSPALSPHRSQPARGRDAATPSQGPQEGQQSQEDKSTSAGESP